MSIGERVQVPAANLKMNENHHEIMSTEWVDRIPLPESEKQTMSDPENDTLVQPQTSDSDSTMNNIPEETLFLIFQHALPPAIGVSFGTLPPFPRINASPDSITKLSIVSVCKKWYRIALEFLYENVNLQWIGQLPAFVQALEAHEELGACVRRLEIGYWVPDEYHVLQDAEIGKIFELCPRLDHFAFNPRAYSGSLPLEPIRRVGALTTITHLEICERVQYAAILPALEELCTTLVSLSILLPSFYDDAYPTLAFKRLVRLRLVLDDRSSLPGKHWVFPNLQQQLLVYFGTLHTGTNHVDMVARAFLAAYGCNLRVLSVRRNISFKNVEDRLTFRELLDRCPILQHVTLTEHPAWRSQDLSAESLDTQSQEQFIALKSAFPQLRTCQYTAPCFDFFPDMPSLPIEGSRTVATSLPQSSCLEFLFSGACDGDEDSEDDPDYVFDPADDDDGSVEDSDSDSDSSNSIDYDNFWNPQRSDSAPAPASSDEEDWEADREEALAIFRRTLVK
ncbi:hypothetical protein MSAN_01964900 [Mycena sanguinolenta]|uniref:F-box domain-containing protein n=1 Tax=Mycena sanguinolenta TaxID=230812 RepID=A0A8H6XNW9_9AGAR|nr:hypothetical protein MSAN_01964900 [Mycena sanguinolenta]